MSTSVFGVQALEPFEEVSQSSRRIIVFPSALPARDFVVFETRDRTT